MIGHSEIIGHANQLNILKKNYNNNFPHAWIFNGIKGIGKYSTAVSFIKSIKNKKIALEQNLFEINSDDNFALIDDVRNLINQMYLTNANSNEKCFIILDNADKLSFNSYNALLKTIEEPPSNTIIFIICHNLNKIPKTVVSRCIKLDFKPLNNEQISEFCKINNIDLNEFNLQENHHFINGSVEKLLLCISDEGKHVREFFKQLNNLTELKHSEFEKFYDQISKNHEKYYNILINYLFAFQKEKYIKNSDNKLNLIKILLFFSNIEIFTKQNLNIDKKKEIHFLISEYCKTIFNE